MFDSSSRISRAALLLVLCSSVLSNSAFARGFGGGGGFSRGGGGFGGFSRGGDFGGGDFGNRGGDWGNRGGDWGNHSGDWGNRGGDWGNHSGDWGGGDHSWANHNWNDHPTPNRSGWHDQPIATDGGFGRIANHPNFNNYGHIGNNTYNINRNTLVNNGNMVRGNFNHYGAFNDGWYGAHPGCWYGGWPASYCYNPTAWAVMAPFLGMTTGMMFGMGMGALASGGGGNGNGSSTTVVNAPVEYDYGNNITYQDGGVYYGSQPVATAGEYYDQAWNLAQSAPEIPSKEQPKQADWKPFGVFSLVQQGQSDSTTLFQIAVNKDGVLRGNYYNTLTDETKPINGAIDKKTMRACWTVSGVKKVVYDTGVANLMDAQSPILVHFGKDKTEQFILVRLQQPGQPNQTQPTPLSTRQVLKLQG